MSLQDEQDEEGAVDTALRVWRQGDFSLDSGLEFIYLAGTTHPHSPDFEQFAPPSGDREVIEPKATPVADEVCGLVVLSQTCDLVRGCRSRPYVEVAPLVEVPEELLRETRRLRRPAFAYVPLAAEKRLVADLDRTMTVEKAVVAHWHRQQGCQTDEERRAFADALTRKRARFAFPDDFVAAASQLQDRLIKKHARATGEGAHLRAVREIRVQAAPSWDDGEVAGGSSRTMIPTRSRPIG